jgi:hypothetical protein
MMISSFYFFRLLFFIPAGLTEHATTYFNHLLSIYRDDEVSSFLTLLVLYPIGRVSNFFNEKRNLSFSLLKDPLSSPWFLSIHKGERSTPQLK